MAKASKTTKANLILEILGLRALIWALEGQTFEHFDALGQHDSLYPLAYADLEDVYEVLRLRLLDLSRRDARKSSAH